ncbi:MAG TPA: rhamnulokinase [Clostridiales bacterium]|nr:rhamnulokinase [Clostridiales bacterium]
MKELNILAFDLGASSGRGLIGRFNGNRLEVEELHRFSNDPVTVTGHTYWDVLRLYWEIQQGLLKFANRKEGSIASIGIDTWGVDYGLLDKSGQLMGNPYHYRDIRTEGMFEEAFMRVPKEEIFRQTGIAFQKFNTLYQLLSMQLDNPEMLEKASTMLFMPDLLTYFLTGEKNTEFTEATTSQMLDAATGQWNRGLLCALGIPDHFLTEIDYPGSARGRVKQEIASLLGINEAPMFAVATHDTGSAVAAVPAVEGSYVFLSSGTWSLMGVEVDKPVINEKTLMWNYTNEGCVGGTYRLLKNIMGLWIIQECKREWDRRGEVYSFDDMVRMAEASTPFLAFIDPDDDLFYNAGDMPAKVQQYCKQTNQAVPQSKGEIIRCIYESLALKYRWSFERLEDILEKSLDVLHIVGGGTKNQLLNQFTANALKKPVICGPTEATAIGNIMVQAMALGEVKNQNEIRQIVKSSFPTEDYLPEKTDAWDEAYARFLKVLKD